MGCGAAILELPRGLGMLKTWSWISMWTNFVRIWCIKNSPVAASTMPNALECCPLLPDFLIVLQDLFPLWLWNQLSSYLTLKLLPPVNPYFTTDYPKYPSHCLSVHDNRGYEKAALPASALEKVLERNMCCATALLECMVHVPNFL